MSHEHDLWTAADKLQITLRQAQAQLVELRSQLAALNLQPGVQHTCPDLICRLQFRSRAKLAEHVYHSHNGPLPDHWARAEQLAE